MRIVIADTHRVFASALAALLRRSGHEVVGYATALEAANEIITREQADVCVLDADLPSGADGIGLAMAASPGTAFVVLADSPESAGLHRALSGKVHGAALKSDDFVEVQRVLTGACARAARHQAGGTALSLAAQAARRATRNGLRYPHLIESLTPREREVLAFLVRGESTSAMARSMGVRLSTTRTHIDSLLIKLGVHSRLEAVAFAVKEGIVDVAEWLADEPKALSG